ncbi:GNAT family N-acetyltransferase [Pontimicrobium sp. MEBiC06410]|jgi:RimJ/RimL family protein N-acetyltransferase
MMNLSVRPIQHKDIAALANYWLKSSDEHLIKMGVDLSKLPSREDLVSMLNSQLDTPIENKKSFALIWLLNGKAIGHCNVNQIEFNKQAFMHLHLWEQQTRHKGLGTQLVKLSIPIFFKALHLQQLFCEPYALNPAPNKTLERIGFSFVKEHVCIPGYLNFEQPVKRWVFNKEKLALI